MAKRNIKNNQDPLMALLGGGDSFNIFEEMMMVNYDERILLLNDAISDDMFEDFCMSIWNWNREDQDIPVEKRKPIKIYINSGGGGVVFGRFVLDCIVMSKTPVWTIGMSQCCSMASYILAAGHERFCMPSTIVLLHDGQSGVFSTSNKAKDTMNFYNRIDVEQTQFMIDHTKMTEEFLEEIKDREYYMFADEAKERGIIDKIVGIDCDLDDIL